MYNMTDFNRVSLYNMVMAAAAVLWQKLSRSTFIELIKLFEINILNMVPVPDLF